MNKIKFIHKVNIMEANARITQKMHKPKNAQAKTLYKFITAYTLYIDD